MIDSKFVRFQFARRTVLILCAALTLAIPALAIAPIAPAAAKPITIPEPVLAYYYIWYTPGSWQRAKTDLPLLGAYSSDDKAVMRQHIEWAKSAGIDGFIVSWKNTPTLTPRLEQLISIAREEDFKLAMIYEGLDFDRNPLPVSQVTADLNYFAERWGNDPVFSIFDRPLVIWSGTWEFTADQIKSATSGVRDKLLILASERSAADYERLGTIVDGDAYYWSSVNPETFAGYEDKLVAMSSAVHANHGIWIAPAAPGFDAHAIGGTTTVDRRNGGTLLAEFNAASASNPDVIGLISWNEFSENSYLEPSKQYGKTYLNNLALMLSAETPPVANFDSDTPSLASARPNFDVSVLLLMALVMISGIAVVSIRAVRTRST